MLRYNYKAFQLTDCPTISECTWFKKFVHKQNCNENLQSCSGKWKMGHLQFSVESSLLSQVTQRDEVQCQLLPWNMEVDRSRSLFFFVPQSSCHETCKGRGPIIWQMSWKKGSFTHTHLHFQSRSRIHKCVNPLWVKITDRFAGFGVLSKYVMKNLQQSIILKREQWFMVLLPQAQSKW